MKLKTISLSPYAFRCLLSGLSSDIQHPSMPGAGSGKPACTHSFFRISSLLFAWFLSSAAFLQAQNLDSISVDIFGYVNTIARDGNHLYLGGFPAGSSYQTGNAAWIRTDNVVPDVEFPKLTGEVFTSVSDGAGGWYLGGDFTVTAEGVTYSRLVHILADKTVDPGFRPDPDGRVWTMELEGNTLYVGGNFTSIDGQHIIRLAKLNAETGMVDREWNPAPDDNVIVLKIDGDKIDVGGDFYRIGGRSQSAYARLDKATGNALLTTSFDSRVNTLLQTGAEIYAGGSFTLSGYFTGESALISTSSVIPDNTAPLLAGQVKTIIPDGTGGWYAGGDFTTEFGGQTYYRLVHINADNSLDADFKPDPDTIVQTLLLDGQQLYVGGAFTTIGGQGFNRLAKLDAQSGIVDGTWSPNPNAPVNALEINGSDLYVGGEFTQVSGMARNYLAAFDKTTGNLRTWNPAPDDKVRDLEISATVLFAGGDFLHVGDSSRYYVAGIDLASGLATNFIGDADDIVTALALDGNTLYTGGDFSFIGGASRTRLAALDAITGNANSWAPSSSGIINDLAVDGGLVYVCSDNVISAGGTRYYLAALDKTTGLASSWNPKPSDVARTIAVSGGAVYIGGSFLVLDQLSSGRLAKIWKSDFLPDTNFFPNPAGAAVFDIELDGLTLYLGGEFSAVDGQSRNNLAAIDRTTGGVNSWDPDVNGAVNDLRIIGDEVFAVGAYNTIGGQSRLNAASLDKTTGVVSSWDPGAEMAVNTISQNDQQLLIGGKFGSINYSFTNASVLQYDIAAKQFTDWNPVIDDDVQSILVRGDTVFLGGEFTMVNGVTRRGFAAVNNTTGALYNLSADLNVGGVVYTMESKSDTLYIGGDFNQVAGQTRNNVAALNRSTGTLLAWDPDANSVVLDIEDTEDGIYLAGVFTTLKGTTRNGIAIVDKNTGIPGNWDPDANDVVYSLAVADDKIYAGGIFTQVGGQPRTSLAALDRGTGNALPWNPNLSANIVWSVDLKGDAVLAAGEFTQVGNTNQRYFTYLDDSTAMPKLWFPEFDNSVYYLDVYESSVLFSGDFTEVNGESRRAFAVLTPPLEVKASIGCGTLNSQVCLDVTTENFTDLKTMQYSMHFDPNVITFNSIQNINLPATFTPNTTQSAAGILTFSWTDNSGQGASLPNGTVMYEICFDLTGIPGTSTEITIDGDPLALEFTNTSNQNLAYVLTPGLIAITLGNLNVWTGGGDGVFWSDSANWCLGVPVITDSVLINTGTVSLDVQPVMSALVVNGGELKVIGGNTYNVNAPTTIGAAAMLNIFDGTLDVNDTLENNGTIEGFGTLDILDAVVTRYGRFAPGNSVGTSRTRGSHSNESAGMEVGFFDGIPQHDRLEITQTMDLGGVLELLQLPGTIPPGTYPLMTCEGGADCRTGNFDNITFFPACGGNCTIEYTPTSANLVVTAPLPFTCTWLGGTGNWSDSTRWDCRAVPTEGSNVVIDSGEVIVNAPITVNGLTLNGGTLSGRGNLTTSGFFALNGGNFALSGRHLISNMSVSNSPTISKGTLTLNGNSTWVNPNLTLSGNTRLRLSATDTLILLADQPGTITATGGGGPVITAFGTVVKHGTASMGIDIPLQLYGGTLDVSEGRLGLNNTFVYSGTVKGNGTLDLTNATVRGLEGGNFSPGASPGTLTLQGNYTNQVLNMEIDENGGTLTKDSLAVQGNIDLSGSTLNVNFTGNVPSGGYELVSFGTNTNRTRFGEVNLTPACADCYLVYGAGRIILGKNCIPDLNLSNLTLDSGTYRSQGEVVAGMSVIPAGQQVTLVSDTGVSLPQDFTVETGGVFEVEIEGCQ